MKRIIFYFFIILVIFSSCIILPSCGSQSTAEDTANGFVNCYKNADYKNILTYVFEANFNSKKTLKEYYDVLEENVEDLNLLDKWKERFENYDMVVDEVKDVPSEDISKLHHESKENYTIDGWKKAKVVVTEHDTNKQSDQYLYLIKVNGKWYIDSNGTNSFFFSYWAFGM